MVYILYYYILHTICIVYSIMYNRPYKLPDYCLVCVTKHKYIIISDQDH